MTTTTDLGARDRADPFGGGAMVELMRSVDWSRTALSILSASGYPMYIAWGPEFVQFYNDAYRPILGATKHPAAMGQSTRVCFAEIWDFIGPLFERVLREGEQTYLEDQLLALDRNGFVEECYFTFSYSPIRDESGDVGGVYVTVIETTGRVLGERRLRLLRELAATASGATSAVEAAQREAVRDVTVDRRARSLRDAYIGVLSHELRTPITTIYAGSKLLTRGSGAAADAGPPVDDAAGRSPPPTTSLDADEADRDRDTIVADIAAEADRLYRLVEDLLVLARFERGATQFPGEPVLLQRILPTVLRSEAARWPHVRFETALGIDLPAVRADPTYAEQIARNLLSNAAKYSEPGTIVRLVAEEGEDEVIVRVVDEGPGIQPEEADRLFELFYRSPSTNRKPGAGIGLFVARRLAESMGGRIWARRRSPRGSEFGFALRVHTDDE